MDDQDHKVDRATKDLLDHPADPAPLVVLDHQDRQEDLEVPDVLVTWAHLGNPDGLASAEERAPPAERDQMDGLDQVGDQDNRVAPEDLGTAVGPDHPVPKVPPASQADLGLVHAQDSKVRLEKMPNTVLVHGVIPIP